MNAKSNVAQLRRPLNEPDTYPQAIQHTPGGRRWGYPLKFKMDAIRMVREQHMPVKKVADALGIGPATLHRWLDSYDLKRIPPKGFVEEKAQAASSSPTSAPTQTCERKDQIRDAIGLLKQAVDLLYTACQPKQAA